MMKNNKFSASSQSRSPWMIIKSSKSIARPFTLILLNVKNNKEKNGSKYPLKIGSIDTYVNQKG
jgi:hypothetical protein